MIKLAVAIWAELIKAYRASIFIITIAIAIFIPLMMGFIMLIIQHPELASKSRMLAIKASMLGMANWTVYSQNIEMAVSAVGLILFGFIASWVFGREYSDRTVKDLIALPVPRSHIVLSKFVVVAVWSFLLTVIIYIIWLAAGVLIKLDGWSGAVVLKCAGMVVKCGLLTILLSTPVAFFASYGRGYLPPVGFIIFTLVIVQIANFSGYSQYVPWAIPMLVSGAAGSGNLQLGLLNYSILIFTCIAGYALTTIWWRFADQN